MVPSRGSGRVEGLYAVSSQAAVLLISRFATCDRIVAAFSKLKPYIVMQGAESSSIVSIMLKRQASSRSKNKSAQLFEIAWSR